MNDERDKSQPEEAPAAGLMESNGQKTGQDPEQLQGGRVPVPALLGAFGLGVFLGVLMRR